MDHVSTIVHPPIDMQLTRSRLPDSAVKIVDSFDTIARALKEAYGDEKRELVMDELETYVEGTAKEERQRLSGRIATVKDFWSFRLDSSAVGMVASLIDYAYGGLDLPSHIWRDDDLKQTIKSANASLSTANDIYSLRREIETDCVGNLIPILYARRGDLDDSLREAVEFVTQENVKLDKAAGRLIARWGDDEKLQRKVEKYCDGCRYLVIGTTSWSLRSRRYELVPGENGVVRVPLR